MSGGCTYQNKSDDRPEGLAKYIIKTFAITRHWLYSPWDQEQIIWYQFVKKTCYLPEISKLYVEKGCDVKAHQQIAFIMLMLSLYISSTLPHH